MSHNAQPTLNALTALYDKIRALRKLPKPGEPLSLPLALALDKHILICAHEIVTDASFCAAQLDTEDEAHDTLSELQELVFNALIQPSSARPEARETLQGMLDILNVTIADIEHAQDLREAI